MSSAQIQQLWAKYCADNPLTAKLIDKFGGRSATADMSKKWHTSVEFKGNKVYQRNDLINTNPLDPVGKKNIEFMKKGKAPIGPDNKPINLHHMLQTEEGAIAEMTQTFHQKNTKIIHINPNTTPSGINRSPFNSWKKDYWKNRVEEILKAQ